MRSFAICAVFLLLATGIAYAGNYSSVKKAGPYEVTVSMDHAPAVVGVNNSVTIAIKEDAAPANDVDPELYYFMPSMPAMNYTVHATRKGESYTALVKPTMPGEWTMHVRVKQPDGGVSTGSFEFTAK